MVPFQIKICGVTNVDDAIFAVSQGADAIGLNFYEKSSRYVCPPKMANPNPPKATAAQIVNAIRDWTRSENGTPVKIIGVFVNLDVNQVVEIANELGLDGVQLHGDEPAEHAREIRDLIEPRRPILLVRAIRTNPRSDQQKDPESEIDHVEIEHSEIEHSELERIGSEIETWAAAGVDAVLLDAAVAGEFGGTGKSVDWLSVPKIKSPVAMILAGGLTADNVGQAIQCAQVQAVDVASGVESGPGEKEDELVRGFVESARVSLDAKT